MKYVSELRTPAAFDEWEAEWREAAYRMVENIEGEVEELPTPDELDEFDAENAINEIQRVAEHNAQLFINAERDVRDWEKVAVARIKARSKAKVPA